MTNDLRDLVSDVVRRTVDAGDPAPGTSIWTQLVELGVLDLVDDPLDGHRHLAAVAHELGRNAVSTPLAENVAGDDWRGLVQLAELVGATRATYERTRAFVGQREQFGAPLLDIPAVATNVAELDVLANAATAALDRVLDRWPSAADRYTLLLAAHVTAAGAATDVSHLAHRLHGAIGLTAEFGLHELTVRLWDWRDRPGTAYELAERLGGLALDGGEALVWDRLTQW